jgi:hypothetical protein
MSFDSNCELSYVLSYFHSFYVYKNDLHWTMIYIMPKLQDFTKIVNTGVQICVVS